MGIAARLAAWERWRPGGLVPSRASGPSFASAATPVGPMVEIFVDSAWVDISPDVRYADKITTTGGRPDESARTQANTCRFTLNNRNGRYSPRNPMSPLYGKIGRNTPVRASVDQAGTKRFRFYGEIIAWPQQWDLTGNDVFVPIEAAGVLRRLNQGSSPLHSTLYRALIRNTDNPVIAYWPMEDGADSTFLASAVANGENMVISGTPSLASFDGFACSEPIPIMSNGSTKGRVPAYTVTGETQVRFLLSLPAAGETNGKRLVRLDTTGTARLWEVYYSTADGGNLGVRAYNDDGVLLQDSGTAFSNSNGDSVGVCLALTQQGADVDMRLVVLLPAETTSLEINVLFTGMTVGRVTALSVNPGQGAGETSIGHVSLQNQTDPSFDLTFLSQIDAFTGETTLARLRRLCEEEGITLRTHTGDNLSPSMGPQRANTLMDLIQECVDTDLGILYEPRDQFGLGWRTRGSLENQTEALSLNYSASDLFEVPIPVDDDQLSRNDVTVGRNRGSSARAVLESGAMSVLPPPNGIGRYDEGLTISLEDDDQLLDQANWRLHMGTVDEPRYPSTTVHLKRPTYAASYDLTAATFLMIPGDRYLIYNTPAWLPPGDVSQIMNSYTEWFDQFEHVISFNGAPESPYRVGYLDDDDLGRADTAGSHLASAVGESDTSLTVTTSSGPVWIDSATYPTEFPFFVMMGGEKINVTAITGTTSPQVFTVDRGVNAITKSQVAGEDIRLFQPMILAL